MLLSIVTVILYSLSCTVQKKQGNDPFPKISNPEMITKEGKEHFFASYYGITSFNNSQRYVTILETDIKHKLPDEREPATLGLVDLTSNEFIPLTTTRAWNFQEGCMAHWLDDSKIIFNDYRNGKFVSIILDSKTKKELKIIPHPVSGISPNGKEALSLNYSRLRVTRTDYGYGGNGQDAQKDIQFPPNDGLFVINLETGAATLIVSLDRIKNMVPPFSKPSIEYFAHTRFNKDGSKIFWLARGYPEWNTSAFTVNRDGSNLQRCFPDGWGGSHYDWLNTEELMITANFDGKQYAHILFTVGKKDYKKLGNGSLDFDAHGTFSPDQKWMVTDGYPDKVTGDQKVYLMAMETGETRLIGTFNEPKEYSNNGLWRCDIHSRWSPKGNMIGFNSTKTGSRQVYIYKLHF